MIELQPGAVIRDHLRASNERDVEALRAGFTDDAVRTSAELI